METVTVTVPVTISLHAIADCVESADVAYWARDLQYANGRGRVQDQDMTSHDFTAETLAGAMANLLTGNVAASPYIVEGILEGISGHGFSADAADCAIQVAAFGEIIYG